jgi:hypothetical protein
MFNHSQFCDFTLDISKQLILFPENIRWFLTIFLKIFSPLWSSWLGGRSLWTKCWICHWILSGQIYRMMHEMLLASFHILSIFFQTPKFINILCFSSWFSFRVRVKLMHQSPCIWMSAPNPLLVVYLIVSDIWLSTTGRILKSESFESIFKFSLWSMSNLGNSFAN